MQPAAVVDNGTARRQLSSSRESRERKERGGRDPIPVAYLAPRAVLGRRQRGTLEVDRKGEIARERPSVQCSERCTYLLVCYGGDLAHLNSKTKQKNQPSETKRQPNPKFHSRRLGRGNKRLGRENKRLETAFPVTQITARYQGSHKRHSRPQDIAKT